MLQCTGDKANMSAGFVGVSTEEKDMCNIFGSGQIISLSEAAGKEYNIEPSQLQFCKTINLGTEEKPIIKCDKDGKCPSYPFIKEDCDPKWNWNDKKKCSAFNEVDNGSYTFYKPDGKFYRCGYDESNGKCNMQKTDICTPPNYKNARVQVYNEERYKKIMRCKDVPENKLKCKNQEDANNNTPCTDSSDCPCNGGINNPTCIEGNAHSGHRYDDEDKRIKINKYMQDALYSNITRDKNDASKAIEIDTNAWEAKDENAIKYGGTNGGWGQISINDPDVIDKWTND